MASTNKRPAKVLSEVQKSVLEQREKAKACRKKWIADQGVEIMRIRSIHSQMKQRCSNPNASNYKNYGARGIKVCERWISFSAFCKDMGPRPSDKHEIDRIDNNGDYTPENCRWAERKTNQRNRRNNNVLTYQQKAMTIVEWSEFTGICAATIWSRLNWGWNVERALTQSVDKISGSRSTPTRS